MDVAREFKVYHAQMVKILLKGMVQFHLLPPGLSRMVSTCIWVNDTQIHPNKMVRPFLDPLSLTRLPQFHREKRRFWSLFAANGSLDPSTYRFVDPDHVGRVFKSQQKSISKFTQFRHEHTSE